MKYALLTLFALALAVAAQAQQAADVRIITFTSFTRGSQEKIVVTPDSLHMETSGRLGNSSIDKAITPAQWKSLLTTLQEVNLSSISSLAAPTHQRESDGAMHSSFIITTTDTTYTSSSFDDRTPPAPLQPLMKQLEALAPSSGKKE